MAAQEPLLGSHMSIAGGTPLALERAHAAGCNVAQIFVKNNNRWQGKIITEEEAGLFRQTRSRLGILQVVAHASYLINLASPESALWKRSREAVVEELERCHRLGLDGLVLHPGSHVGSGQSRGIRRIARALDQIRRRAGERSVPILLETTAGQGTSVGHRFEQLRDILDACRDSEDLGICLDTCHVFAAGYDIRELRGYLAMRDALQETVGLDRVAVLHLNDSRREVGSRVDRHTHIGRGCIGEQGFAWIMNDPAFDGVPKILETPKGKTHREDRRNLKVLRSLLRPSP